MVRDVACVLTDIPAVNEILEWNILDQKSELCRSRMMKKRGHGNLLHLAFPMLLKELFFYLVRTLQKLRVYARQ